MTIQNKNHIRQHYIPQFLLRNFCLDDNRNKVHFYDSKKKDITTQFVANVFMEKRLYSKENDLYNTLVVEEGLAKFETEVSAIFKKLNDNPDIILSFDEDNELRIFLSLLAFRSVNTRNQFCDGLSESSKAIYSGNQANFDFGALWLENVYLISQCRNIDEILKNPSISEPIKLFLATEFVGFYMCILEKRGNVDFVISDCYPTVLNGEVELPNGRIINLPIYYFYPISPNRIIILTTNHIKDVPQKVSYFNVCKTLKAPKRTFDGKLLFHPNKLYKSDVEWINQMIIENASVGIVIKDMDSCSSFVDL